MASIPLSSFLGAASQVVTGLIQGKMAGEAQAAEQAQQQQQLAQQAAQQRQAQQNFLSEMQLRQQTEQSTERHRVEEERLRGVDIERKRSVDAFKQQHAGEDVAAKGRIAGAKSWQQAQQFAQRESQVAIDGYNRVAPTLNEDQKSALWESTQARIQGYNDYANSFGASPWQTMNQPPGATTETPRSEPGATPTPAAGTVSTKPVAGLAKLPGETPKQADERLKREARAKEAGARQKRFETVQKGKEEDRGETRWWHRQLLENKDVVTSEKRRMDDFTIQWKKAHPPGARAGAGQQVKAAADIKSLMNLIADPKKWPAMDPRMRQSFVARLNKDYGVLGQKPDKSLQSYIQQTVGAPQRVSGKTGLTADQRRDFSQAMGTLKATRSTPAGPRPLFDPGTPEGLASRSSAFAYLESKSDADGKKILQDRFPLDYQNYVRSQPAPKTQAVAAPTVVRAPGGPPVLPPATPEAANVPQTMAPQQPPPTAPPTAPPRTTQPAPKTQATTTKGKGKNIHGGYDYTTKQGVPPPKGEDPVVWKSVRQAKPPYGTGTPQWGVWQLFIGQGIQPEAILNGLKSNPQAFQIAKDTLKEINDQYLSGPRATAAQQAAGEGKPSAGKPSAAQPPAGGINYGANVPSSWLRVDWPPRTTAVESTGAGMGVMTLGRSRFPFHFRGGKPVIDKEQ